ncbi:MAG TPA: hypothetical protein VIY49_37095, partial [Bryobacteraceae bacterium]
MKITIGRSVWLVGALAAFLTQTTFAQTPAPSAPSDQKSADSAKSGVSSDDVAKEIQAMKQRIQQLERQANNPADAPADGIASTTP